MTKVSAVDLSVDELLVLQSALACERRVMTEMIDALEYTAAFSASSAELLPEYRRNLEVLAGLVQKVSLARFN